MQHRRLSEMSRDNRICPVTWPDVSNWLTVCVGNLTDFSKFFEL